MNFNTEFGTDLDTAIRFLNEEQTVAIPTETVYGLAGNGLSKVAIERIYQAKNRPSYNPLILHTSSLERAKEFVSYIPDSAYLLAEKFWPGPLTLLLPKASCVPDQITSGLPRVAVRIPRHPLTLKLLEQLEFPLAAPSANPFGYISPTTAKHVMDQLGGRIPYVLDGGSCSAGIESTIIGFEDDICVAHRLGALEISEIEEIVGLVSLKNHDSAKPIGPGMLPWHYSPRTPLVLCPEGVSLAQMLATLSYQYKPEELGLVHFLEDLDLIPKAQKKALSPDHLLKEAGKNLYSSLHDLDKLGLKMIIAERLPQGGLGDALNDRLHRASQKPETLDLKIKSN